MNIFYECRWVLVNLFLTNRTKSLINFCFELFIYASNTCKLTAIEKCIDLSIKMFIWAWHMMCVIEMGITLKLLNQQCSGRLFFPTRFRFLSQWRGDGRFWTFDYINTNGYSNYMLTHMVFEKIRTFAS